LENHRRGQAQTVPACRFGDAHTVLLPGDILIPVGEWNTTRLVVNGPHIEHWLNGQKIVEFERWTAEWKKLRDAGKWKEYPDYGLAKTGRIAIQDHGSVFWFRNIKIRSTAPSVIP
jgi:hypothetical protein